MISTKPNWLDRTIAIVAPSTATRRVMARAAFNGLTRKYDGAARGRLTEGWTAAGTSADAEIGHSLPLLRARHRDLVRNNPHARKAVSVWKTNLVGAGIKPRSMSGDKSLNTKADELWDEWVGTADAGGQLDFYGLQELAVGIMIEGGDVLVRRRLLPRNKDLRVPLQLQVMEGDHLDHSKSGEISPGRMAVQGVEFDKDGARAAYWLFRDHPGNSWLSSTQKFNSNPVSAAEIIHLYRKERTQTRGVPWGSACINNLRNIDDYEIAEIVRKKTEACVVAIVVGAEEGQEGIAPKIVDSAGKAVERFEPGLIAYAHGGKEIRFNSPSAQGGYGEYKSAGLHTVAAGYLVPYELLTGDLSEVNFTSARVGLVQFRTLVETIQWLTVIPMMLNRIRAWFCEAAYLAGELPVPFVPCQWNPPRFESVNPIDDANADLIEIRSGTRTLRDAIARRGRNPDEVFREHAETAKLLDELKLIFDSDPRNVTRGGNEQPSISQQAAEAARK